MAESFFGLMLMSSSEICIFSPVAANCCIASVIPARRVDVDVHLQAQAIDRIPLCLKSCAISTIAFVFAGLYSCP
jgi:hypothetical protein